MAVPGRLTKRQTRFMSLIVVLIAGANAWASAPAIPGKPGPPTTAPSSPWRLYPKCGDVSSLAADEKRNCVWFAGNWKVGKIDLATDKVTFLDQPKDQPGLGARRLALEGDRLWIGGYQGVRLDDKEGGGLGLYDIPSDSLLIYRVSNTRSGDRPGLPCNDLIEVLAEKDQVWLYTGSGARCWGLTRFRWKEKDPSARWTTLTAETPRRPAEPHAGPRGLRKIKFPISKGKPLSRHSPEETKGRRRGRGQEEKQRNPEPGTWNRQEAVA